MKKFFASLMICLIAGQVAMANTTDLLRVHVIEESEGTEVKVNIPMNTLEAFRPTIQNALSDIEVDGHEIDLREIWQQIKDAGPNDFVEINQDGTRVLVATTAENEIRITIEGEDNVNVRIPFALADAFLGHEEIDYDTVMEALYDIEGDLVNVTGDDVQVRVWIEQR